MKELTRRQKEVLSFIASYIKRHAYPPTIRDIADHFSISVKGAYDHIAALKRKNCLKQDGKRSRTMELVHSKVDEDLGTISNIPIVGTVAAGTPILSEEDREGIVALHYSMLKRNKTYFAVRVRGDSMSGVGIMDGDMAVIEKISTAKNGDIVVATVDDDAGLTLKRFFKESARFKLEAENPGYPPIYCREVRIEGRLAHIIRQY